MFFSRGSCVEDIKPPVCPDIDIVDNTQCKFNLASFKMVFVVNSDSYMYKKQALKRAKEVRWLKYCVFNEGVQYRIMDFISSGCCMLTV